jgi:hypothetical protein
VTTCFLREDFSAVLMWIVTKFNWLGTGNLCKSSQVGRSGEPCGGLVGLLCERGYADHSRPSASQGIWPSHFNRAKANQVRGSE